MQELLIKQIDFTQESINNLENEKLTDYPVVYLLNDEKEIYIGETTVVRNRLKQHLKNKERQKLTQVSIIGHDKFNQSATYNIETNLINYFIGDETFKIQNISQTTNFVVHNYYEKQYYHENVTHEIWDELLKIGLAKDSIDIIENKDIYKVSPYKSLSPEQYELKAKIIDFCLRKYKKIVENPEKSIPHSVFIIRGEAGSGKSVVISSIMKAVQDLSKDKFSHLNNTNNYLLVNHSEMLKTYERLSTTVKNFQKNKFLKPTIFINRLEKKNEIADIVIVDEGHLLLTKKDAFNSFQYDNHLEEIIKRARITIVVFDEKQSLRAKGKWGNKELDGIVVKYRPEYLELKQQFRMRASESLIQWIDDFVAKKMNAIPIDESYDFQIFEDAGEMYQKIKLQNNGQSLSRIVATFDYIHKKDKATYYVEEPNFKLPWNTIDDKMNWAEREETIDEVGSIYTIQGFDLNYVGVIIGPSIYFDEGTQSIQVDTTKYKDTGAFSGANDAENPNDLKEQIILNGLNVLLKRGIEGLYIYASDKKLSSKLNELYREMQARKDNVIAINSRKSHTLLKIAEDESKY